MSQSSSLYLAWSAIGRPSDEVTATLAQAARRHAEGGFGALSWMVEQSAKAAEGFADLIGADSGTVARTGSTSEGLVAVAQMTPWRPGDVVVIFGGEFPANRTPWLQAAKQHGLVVREVDSDLFFDPSEGIEALDRALAGGARMVAVSAVQFHHGLRMPIADIARRAHTAGAEICVDAIQAVGIVPVDVSDGGVDWLAAGGHKWLGAPVGTGFLYGRPASWSRLRPHLASWLSHRDPMRFLTEPDARPDPDAFAAGPALVEGGMRNHPGLAGAVPAIDRLLRRDLAADLGAVGRLHDAFEEGLQSRGFGSLRASHTGGRSGILAADPPAGWTAVEIAEGLARRHCFVTAPEGRLRIAPSPDLPEGAVHRFFAALDQVMQQDGGMG